MDSNFYHKLLYVIQNSSLSMIDNNLKNYDIQIIDTSAPLLPLEVPVLVGTLNKPYGTKGYKISEVGTPVYEFQGFYQIETFPIEERLPMKIVKFYKDRFKSLQPL